MTYKLKAEFCDHCKRFTDTYEENYADPGAGLGYSTSGPYCVDCGGCTRSVNWCVNQMYEVERVYSNDIPF